MDGIAGIYSNRDDELVHKIFLATGACQHRGKASAGIAIGTEKGLYIHNGIGRIGEVVGSDIMRPYQDLAPFAAIGNVGYTKNKIPEQRNAEPIRIHPKGNSNLEMAITMDGYLVKENDLKAELEHDYHFETGNKTEVVGAFLHKYMSEEGISFGAGKRLLEKLEGRATFALAALVYDGKETHLVTLNDSKAFEPFCFGDAGGAFVAASESVAHRRLGAYPEREYDGGEMTICSANSRETRRLVEGKIMPDIFQGVYFGHVGSTFRGKEIMQIRNQLGRGLVGHYGKTDVDIVIPNPESGWGVTIGLADAFEKPLLPALIKQAQAVRTFQESERRQRSIEVGLKFGGVESMLRGKKIAMGDDSIVKGSVSEGGSVWVVYNCGAARLEFWVSYGPMLFPSFKEWHRGKAALDELAVQRAFKEKGRPYGKSVEEINKAVGEMVAAGLEGIDKSRFDVYYNTPELVKEAAGDGSFQAMDASYPIDEAFWPDWLKKEVELFHQSKGPKLQTCNC